MKFNISIRNRLLISFAILIFFILTIFGGYILCFFHSFAINHLKLDLKNQAGMFGGLLVTAPPDFNLDRKIKHISQISQFSDNRITILDLNGNVIADSFEDVNTLPNFLDRPEVIAALSGKTGNAIRCNSSRKERTLYVAIPVYLDKNIIGAIQASAPLSTIESAFQQIVMGLITALLFALFIAIIFSFLLANRYSSPIEKIIAVTKEITKGRLDKRIYLNTGDELEILGETLNNLTKSLEEKIIEITTGRRKFELILQHMDNGVILFDKFGQIKNINSSAINIFNIDMRSIEKYNFSLLGGTLFEQAVEKVIYLRQNLTIQLTLDINNEKRIFHAFIAPFISTDASNTEILSVYHDITTLQELNTRQSEFVANASHELATPLTVIKGFAETLLDGAIDDPKTTLEFIKIINTEAERMTRLVNDLLLLARSNSDECRKKLDFELLKLNDYFLAVIQELMPQFILKEQIVNIYLPEKAVCIYSNSDFIKQILVNLLNNSNKYTPIGGRIFIALIKTEYEIMFNIRDSGIGIPKQDLPYIFDRFYRVDRTRSRAAGGTGLGLSIVKNIVENIGGIIEVKSEVDIGTEFIITLPILKK